MKVSCYVCKPTQQMHFCLCSNECLFCGVPIFGASLSEPHTSGTALRKCVYVRTYVLACGHIP